jgi:hypothetical protein
VGTWGYGLFCDDTALDVRGDYRDLIRDHPDLDDAEATRRMLARFGLDLIDTEDDAAIIWLALAVSQSQLGRLDPAVAARALQVLDNDEGMDIWRHEGPAAVRRRRRGIAWVRGRLTGPQPRRRDIPMPRRTSLEPGDVLAYRVTSGESVLLRVARIYRNEPVCVLLDFADPQVPALEEIALYPDFLWVDQWSIEGRIEPFTMQVYQRIDYAQAGFTLIGNIGTKPGDENVDADRQDNWNTALMGSAVLSKLLRRHAAIREQSAF